MVTLTAFIMAIAATASALPATNNPRFQIVTCVTRGNQSFDNLFLATDHTGAGSSAVVPTSEVKLAADFVIHDGILAQPVHITGSSGTTYYGFGLDKHRPETIANPGSKHPKFVKFAPVGYKSTFVYVGAGTPGFSNPGNGEPLEFSAPEKLNFGSFAFCNAGNDGFYGDPQPQLLWRTADAATNYKQCADVELIAHYV